MKTCTRCLQSKDESAFHRLTKNKATGRQPKCKECKAKYFRSKYHSDPDFRAHHNATNSEWTKKNLAHCREVLQAKRKANPEFYKSLVNKRRASIRKSQPVWANAFYIGEIYHLAMLRNKLTNVKWHVDHIVPLNGKTVCGLHNEFNLRIIPAKDNLKKSNKWH